MSGPIGGRGSSPPSTPQFQRRLFTRLKRPKLNADHIGKTSNIQTFFEASGSSAAGAGWVEYAPPSLSQHKKIKQEGAALQVYKCRQPEDLGHDSFYIHKVRLQSPFLRDTLKDTLETHGIIYNKNDVFAESVTPHRGLFFARDKVAELAKTADNETTRNHCELLCLIIEEIFDDTFNKLEVLEKEGKITFQLLWTLFPERSIYVLNVDNTPPRALRVKSITQDWERLKLTSEIIIFDGFRYGTALLVDRIFAFEGAVAYADIPDFSYTDLSRRDDLCARLLERGRHALDMQTIAYVKAGVTDDTKGIWLKTQDQEKVIIDPYLYGQRKGKFKTTPLPGYNIRYEDEPDEEKGLGDEYEPRRHNDRGSNSPPRRYDNAVRHSDLKPRSRYESRIRRQNGSTVREAQRRPTKSEIDLNRRVVLESEENLLIMHYQVTGYSVDQRTWDSFPIDRLTQIEADKSVFEKVVLDEKKKDILKTLVEGHMELTTQYDDLISGKGQCLLVILSGPPGTGKTLVAESLAEHLGCPLLRADPHSIQSDIFQYVQGYDATLAQFLKDATEWGSLVLFDEPDFLFQNQEHSTDRENLLAFLRQAEYFKGIIFLTTNLGRTIDPAVLSRAQIHITFPSLTEQLRVRVWQNFVDRVPEDVGSLSPTDIAQLATWRVNGREIKNILNMAVTWYRKRGEFSIDSIESLITTICPSAQKEDAPHSASNCHSIEKTSSREEDLVLLDL